MKQTGLSGERGTGHLLLLAGITALAVGAILTGLHLWLPAYTWGQGRSSYFRFEHRLSLPSWWISSQFAVVGLVALVAWRRWRRSGGSWLILMLLAAGVSFDELTRFTLRLDLTQGSATLFDALLIASGQLGIAVLAVWLLVYRAEGQAPRWWLGGWVVAWTAAALIGAGPTFGWLDALPGDWVIALRGLGRTAGATCLLMGTLQVALLPEKEAVEPAETRHLGWIFGLGLTTGIVIALQVLLFRLLTIFGDYLDANAAISIALLGLAIGACIAAVVPKGRQLGALQAAIVLLPLGILYAFGVAVEMFGGHPWLSAVLLMAPFLLASMVITLVLARRQAHLAYAVDLLGAGAGVLIVNPLLVWGREEGAALGLAAIACVAAWCFWIAAGRRRLAGSVVAGLAIVALISAGMYNRRSDQLNVVREDLRDRYPEVEFYHSSSSLIGRYDVVRRRPHYSTLKSYENGRTIDTIRENPPEDYQVDPRLPPYWSRNPRIMIIGLSGDAITKTARFHSNRVTGIEINPAIVSAHRNELAPYNGNSYEGIDVITMDARSYLEHGQGTYDMITMLNTHKARGHTQGRSPSTEYLFTIEAATSYYRQLSPEGMLIIEEPVSRPEREPPVWKWVLTLREMLRQQGVTEPQRHFFIFQWRTRTNNYVQILMKKTPFREAQIAHLKDWLRDCDRIKQLSREAGHRMGPITARTTVLYEPFDTFETAYATILEDRAPPWLYESYNLVPTTDDRPFHFHVRPGQPELRQAYLRVLILVVVLLPFLWMAYRKSGVDWRRLQVHSLLVMLTGLAFFMVEMVLIQRFEIYLGRPVLTFCAIMGTLLVFGSLGSLLAGRVSGKGMVWVLGALLVLLAVQALVQQELFRLTGGFAASGRVLVTVLSVAPLAVLLGMPFPYVMRDAQGLTDRPSAAVLFGLNAAASSLAVPFAYDLAMVHGLRVTFLVGALFYVMVGALLWVIRRQVRTMPARAIVGACLAITIAALASPWWFVPKPVAPPEVATVHAVRYGYSYWREDRVLLGGDADERIPFGWYFWVIQKGDRIILVDTGTDDPKMVERWNIRDYHHPMDQLRALGIEPEAVTDVILTHSHWDHMGCLRDLPKARVWLQQAEFEFARQAVIKPGSHTHGVARRDFVELLKAQRDERLELVEGGAEVMPGVQLELDGSHTQGIQFVRVQTIDGQVVIAADITYTYQNNRRHIPVARAHDTEQNMRTIRRMHRMAASPFLIIPGHDPDVGRFFPEVAEDIVEITMRAD